MTKTKTRGELISLLACDIFPIRYVKNGKNGIGGTYPSGKQYYSPVRRKKVDGNRTHSRGVEMAWGVAKRMAGFS